jgi:prevent-host-death family protein
MVNPFSKLIKRYLLEVLYMKIGEAMKVIEVAGEAARNRWGEMVDTALGGGEVVVKRHRRPVAVLVNYAAWQAWKKQRRSQLDRLSSKVDAGKYLTQEQVEAEMRARGQID